MDKTKKVKYKALSKKGTDRLYRIVFWPVFLVLSIFHPVRVKGRENIPAGAAVITPNHSSNFDPLMAIMTFGAKYPLRIMAKEELFHIPILGWLMIKFGMFGVNRGHSDMAAIKQAIRVLKEDCKLMLFPEGLELLLQKMLPVQKQERSCLRQEREVLWFRFIFQGKNVGLHRQQ